MSSSAMAAASSTVPVNQNVHEQTADAKALVRCAQQGIQAMSSEHDLERIGKGAQAFFEMLDEADFTLDQFMIIGIVSERTGGDNEEEVEEAIMWCSSQRVYLQRGIIETMLDRMKLKGVEDDEADED